MKITAVIPENQEKEEKDEGEADRKIRRGEEGDLKFFSREELNHEKQSETDEAEDRTVGDEQKETKLRKEDEIEMEVNIEVRDEEGEEDAEKEAAED